jgi:hypothetical protein
MARWRKALAGASNTKPLNSGALQGISPLSECEVMAMQLDVMIVGTAVSGRARRGRTSVFASAIVTKTGTKTKTAH